MKSNPKMLPKSPFCCPKSWMYEPLLFPPFNMSKREKTKLPLMSCAGRAAPRPNPARVAHAVQAREYLHFQPNSSKPIIFYLLPTLVNNPYTPILGPKTTQNVTIIIIIASSKAQIIPKAHNSPSSFMSGPTTFWSATIYVSIFIWSAISTKTRQHPVKA